MKEKLLLIWKDPDSKTGYTIGELIKNDNEYLFHYVNPELNSALDKKFTTYPGFPNYEEEYKSENLFPNISGICSLNNNNNGIKTCLIAGCT